MSHEEDKTKGKAEEYKGKGKQAYGSLADDEKTKASGEADEGKGKARQKVGDAKEWVKEKTGKKDEDEN